MAFWSTLTAAQLARLMRERDRSGLREGWGKLTSRILSDPDNPGNTMDYEGRRLSSSSRIPALHFFLWAALIDWEEDREFNFQTLAEEYLPELAPTSEAARKLFNRLYGGAFSDTEGALSQLTADLASLDRDSSLELLWSSLREHNETAHEKGAEWDISGGLDTLRAYLDGWDPVCAAMWAAVQTPFIGDICGLIQGGIQQLILTGAPGTGKTYLSRQAALCMGETYELVQFHPSYDYTDFVEGLRPVEGEAGSRFVRLDGSFKAFCRRADGDRDKLYFFLIDEINRADLSKVFGELMYCLESDKRGEGYRVQTQYRNLPAYQVLDGQAARWDPDIFAAGFYIPENVVILGTMNDIDRSVESMDFALRRRFAWQEVQVTQALLENAFQSGSFLPLLRENAKTAAQRTAALNRVICPREEEAGPFGLNRQYYISQGQFSGLPDQFSCLDQLLRFVWDCRVSFLLQEYVRGENPRQVRDFLARCRSAFLSGGDRP